MIWVPLGKSDCAISRAFMRLHGVDLDGDPNAHFIAQREGSFLVACAAYTDFREGMCEMHVAVAPGTMIARGFMWALFDYPFNQCGYDELVAWVDEDNARMCDILFRLGFRAPYSVEREGKAPLVLFSLRAESACNFSGGRYGIEKPAAARA